MNAGCSADGRNKTQINDRAKAAKRLRPLIAGA
jgi:hypothetical protein